LALFLFVIAHIKKKYTTKNLLVEQFKGKEEQLPLFIKEKIN
jgi:hypothetical protein